RWLRERGLEHTSGHFRRFACFEYCPGPLRCRLEVLSGPHVVRAGEPAVVRVRCHNTSIDAWQMLPGLGGIHLQGSALGLPAEVFPRCRAGLFEARVLPGESIDLDLAFPPLHAPGHYTMMIDMVQGPDLTFNLFG